MPSSLTRVRSSVLASSACPPVSVCGTGSPSLPMKPFVPVQVLATCRRAETRLLVLASQRLRAYQLERSSSDRSRSLPGSPWFNAWYWCRNLNRLSIAYAFPPRLRPDSPTAECPCSGTLGLSTVGVLTPLYVTHPDIRTRYRSTLAHADASLQYRRSPTTGAIMAPIPRFGTWFSPAELSAQRSSTSELLRTLSRVAASKPTSWLSGARHFLCH